MNEKEELAQEESLEVGGANDECDMTETPIPPEEEVKEEEVETEEVKEEEVNTEDAETEVDDFDDFSELDSTDEKSDEEPETGEESETGEETETAQEVQGETAEGEKEEPKEMSEEELNERREKRRRVGKILGIVLASAIALCAIIYFGGAIYYRTHFYPGTNLGNFNCSNLNAEKAEEKIREELNNYVFTIKERDNKEEYIYGTDIELQCADIQGIDEALNNQNSFGWLTDKAAREQSVQVTVTYNEDKLYQIAEYLDCAAQSRTDMDGAEAGVYYENGAYHMKEVEGVNVISFTKFYSRLKAGIYGTYRDMSLEDEGIYVLMGEEDKLKAAIDEMNKCVSASITYTKGDQTFVVNNETINTWLTLNPDYTISISDDGINAYVSELASLYDTVGSWREFTSSTGEVITVGGGDYGWKIDTAGEAAALKNNISAGEVVTREPVYKKQGIGTLSGKYDIPNTYVEVSIANQKMWYYKDGTLALSSNVVTGNPLKGNGTHTGVFSLKYKQKDAVLKGEGYETPVGYWMPFNGGEGLHDANWRGVFGGTIYRGGGSHGCVNLPPSVAASLFSMIAVGTPVIVY